MTILEKEVTIMNYGERLAGLRKKNNLSQEALCKKLGINRSTYARYEVNRTQPDFETLLKISNFYKVTTDYLLGRSAHPELTAEDDEKSFDYYKSKIAKEFPDIDLMFKDMESLSAEDMKEVYEYIKFKMNQKKDD
ncbi:helix-turn-helix transcriptional regulator [Bacillus sp. A301a_S52]|jgi:transcriptional regulator with XRE-family HTH domain|nr:helix-turn-helix transcriptional regulator [Bacillus sp. A301a_S52]